MIRYKVFEKKDIDDVLVLWKKTAGMGLNPVDDSISGISQYLDRNPKTSFVALDEGKIVGVIMAGNDGRRGFIYHTAVDENHRRNGIAKQLVMLTLNALRAEEIHKVALVAFKDNALGNEFWQSMGFTLRTDLNYRNYSLDM